MGNGLGVPKKKCRGCRCLNAHVVVFCGAVFSVSCITAGAGAVFKTAGDGKWRGVLKTKCRGCRSLNTRVMVLYACCTKWVMWRVMAGSVHGTSDVAGCGRMCAQNGGCSRFCA